MFLLFSTRAYDYLRDAIHALVGGDLGTIETKFFPDGERYQRIATPTEGRDVVLVGGTVSDADTLELYDLACGLAGMGARRMTIVVPYFGYATMERAVKRGEVVTAKNRARLLSSIPTMTSRTRVLVLDVHSEGIPHYFEGATRAVHVYGKSIITAIARRIGGDDFVLACTDAGRAKWVESLANDMHVPASFVYKRRLDERRTEVTAVSAGVDSKCVVIYDDMIRTGGSLLHAAQAYRAAGASSIAAVTTHALFPGDALERLQASALFTSIVCTDSHPRARELSAKNAFLEVESCAPVLAAAIQEGE